MAKSPEKLRARDLRRAGESIGVIARTLNVSKSSASKWCNDIELSQNQAEAVARRRLIGGAKGRLIGARIQKERKAQQIASFEKYGLKKMQKVRKKDLFMAGLGLYSGEGTKDTERFQFTNSNPQLVIFMLRWLYMCFDVQPQDINCRIYINKIHADRVPEIEIRWAELLSIPRGQFKKTVLINVANKKIYENNESYLGTLALCVKRGSTLQRRILGLMHGLVYNIIQKPA